MRDLLKKLTLDVDCHLGELDGKLGNGCNLCREGLKLCGRAGGRWMLQGSVGLGEGVWGEKKGVADGRKK
jgi:hypothetical protein